MIDSLENKSKILEKFIALASLDGWSKEALEKAFLESGIEPKFIAIIFENGCLDLAEFYIDAYNQKAAEKIAEIEGFSSKKIRDKIRLWLYLRFEIEVKNKIAIQRLINFYFTFETAPRPKIAGLKACFKIADFMWDGIGDKSTDFNYYTKRLTLAKIIFRTLAVFLKNDDFDETKKFIDKEIEKVMRFESMKYKVKTHAKEFLFDGDKLKNPKEIINNLPFFRLRK